MYDLNPFLDLTLLNWYFRKWWMPRWNAIAYNTSLHRALHCLLRQNWLLLITFVNCIKLHEIFFKGLTLTMFSYYSSFRLGLTDTRRTLSADLIQNWCSYYHQIKYCLDIVSFNRIFCLSHARIQKALSERSNFANFFDEGRGMIQVPL